MTCLERQMLAAVVILIINVVLNGAAWEYGRDVTQPILLKGGNEKRDAGDKEELFTSETKDRKVAVQLKAFQRRVILDLEKTGGHLASSVLVKTFDQDNNPVEETYSSDCYYHGVVRDSPNSAAAFSTCNGLKGAFEDESGHYTVQPLNQEEPGGTHEVIRSDGNDRTLPKQILKQKDYVQYMLPDPNDPMEFDETDIIEPTRDDEVSEDNRENDIEEKVEKRTAKILKHNLVNVEPVYRKYPNVNTSGYMEMYIAIDNGIYQESKNNTRTVVEGMLEEMNMIDRQFSAINLRLVIVGIEIWTTGDRMPRSNNSGKEIGTFRKYFLKEIQGKSSIDVAHFMSANGWINWVEGTGYLQGACSPTHPIGINHYYLGSSWIVSHELAHNLGMPHDGDHCKCLQERGGCLMKSGSKCRLCGFSDCGMEGYSRKTYRCFNNYPKNTFKPVCGNGIIDSGEECDCGTPETCRKLDSCCQPYTCKLKLGNQCSDFATPGCCSKCMFKPQGTLCRESSGSCDFPEYCTGQAGACPANLYAKDGTSCNSKAHPVTQHGSLTTVNFVKLLPAVEARYVKLLPRKPGRWVKQHCLRTEVLGCGLSQAQGSLPTPVLTRDLFNKPSLCISPDRTSCSYKQDANLIYRHVSKSNCNQKPFKFVHEPDGKLRHFCTNKLLCPKKDGSRILISSACAVENAKFKRTPEGLLVHVATGKCVVESRNHPEDGKYLRLSSKCKNIEANKLDFQVPDCLIPQGMESGLIPDKAVTAKSYFTAKDGYKHLPSKGRLWFEKGYCANSVSDNEYLQIDLQKEMKIGALKVQTNSHLLYLEFSNDKVHWTSYSNSGTEGTFNSFCYLGNCQQSIEDQCKQIWGSGAKKADTECWQKLNTEAKGYGTCLPGKNVSCATGDVGCGQLQCSSKSRTPAFDNYGKFYKKIKVNSKTCSGASITIEPSDAQGAGMVEEGTKCGTGKVCHKYKCVDVSKAFNTTCLKSNGKECGGKDRGICLSNGKCYCFEGYDPSTGCEKLPQPRDGGLGSWTTWSKCSKPCGSGTQKRFRYCDTPYPAHGGKTCVGVTSEEQKCNVEACPVTGSCKQLMKLRGPTGEKYPSGFYSIKVGNEIIKTYCDMDTSGGGWTLIVSSRTNTWTSENVLLRNADKPSVVKDFSILKYADAIKNDYSVIGKTFEYRLDAQKFGHNGGVWRGPRLYSFVSKSMENTNVELLEKYGEWKYARYGLSRRMPYIYNQMLTTSGWPQKIHAGTITDNKIGAMPALWISGKIYRPEHIWYWLREGDQVLPRSCKEITSRVLITNYPSGIYNLSINGETVRTFCDMDRFGGSWTLALTRATKTGWTRKNVKKRNSDKPSKTNDYSIYEYVNKMKGLERADQNFHYIIEADGENKFGGLFSSSSLINLLTYAPENVKPRLIKKFGSWSEKSSSLATRTPYVTDKNGVFLTTSSTDLSDVSGSLVYTASSKGSYLPGVKDDPSLIRIWIREGGHRKSCNDYKLHGQQNGQEKLSDGLYFIEDKEGELVPVYCDMTSSPSGWTLLVTSAKNNWRGDQVTSRNEKYPSLGHDYSILRLGDKIKSLSNNETILYKIEAKERNHYGGIFEVPSSYTFLSKNNSQTNVRLVSNYSTWTFGKWTQIRKRMPWLGDAKYHSALLTTANEEHYSWFGSIISGNTHYHPAPYMYGVISNPGIIWYWVNEDDCGPDRKPVDGHYSQWSTWSPCSAICGIGNQSRSRGCDSPANRCGGKPCDPNESTFERQLCQGPCKVSNIRSHDDRFCMMPETGGCKVTDDTRVVWREGSDKCSLTEAQFVFDAASGTIIHKCSEKRVCPLNMKIGYGTEIVISSTCPSTMPLMNHFQRTYYQSLSISGFCIHPVHSPIRDGRRSCLRRGCYGQEKFIMKFDQLANGPVQVDIYNGLKGTGSKTSLLTTDSRYPNNPSVSGYIDNFDIPPDMGSNYAVNVKTYFVSPMTGNYIFYAACDDFCTLAISSDAKPENAKIIIKVPNWTGRYKWNKHGEKQMSESIYLRKGHYYFMQGNFVEKGGGDHFSVGMKLPNGKIIRPITKHYLAAKTSQSVQ